MKKKISLSFLDQLLTGDFYDFYTGTWCLSANEKSSQIIANPILNPVILQKQSEYVDQLTERICLALTPVMNQHFKVNFSEKYWKIVFSSFVIHWISSNYYKYLILKNLQSVLSLDDELVINSVHLPESFYNYKTTTNYIECVLDDYFIHWEFQQMAAFLFKNNIVINQTFLAKKNIQFDRSHLTYKEKILRIVGFGGSYYLGRVYNFSISEKISIHFSLLAKGLPYILKSFFAVKKWKGFKPHAKLKSDWNFIPQNEFEQYVSKNIFQIIPNTFTTEIPKQSFLMKVKTIITTTSYNDQVERFNVARIVENGGKWFSPQHGGGYAFANCFSPTTVDEYSLADIFLSWGWYHHRDYKINALPLPSPMLSKLHPYLHEDQKDILIVSTASRKIPFRFISYLTINSKKEYRETQLSFLKNLNKSCLPYVLYKEHSEIINEVDDLNSFIKEKHIRRSIDLATIAAEKSRLVVVDHLGTTPLQTYTMNVPTIMYWPEGYFDLTPEAYTDFLELKKCKLWFNDPIEAATFINENYNDIWTWWNCPEVQRVKNNFIKKYAQNAGNYFTVWKSFIKQHA